METTGLSVLWYLTAKVNHVDTSQEEPFNKIHKSHRGYPLTTDAAPIPSYV